MSYWFEQCPILIFFPVLRFINNFEAKPSEYKNRVYLVLLGTINLEEFRILSPEEQVVELLKRLFAIGQTSSFKRPDVDRNCRGIGFGSKLLKNKNKEFKIY